VRLLTNRSVDVASGDPESGPGACRPRVGHFDTFHGLAFPQRRQRWEAACGALVVSLDLAGDR